MLDSVEGLLDYTRTYVCREGNSHEIEHCPFKGFTLVTFALVVLL